MLIGAAKRNHAKIRNFSNVNVLCTVYWYQMKGIFNISAILKKRYIKLYIIHILRPKRKWSFILKQNEKYISFKVLPIASDDFLPSFWPETDFPMEKCFVLVFFKRTQPFFVFFEKLEALLWITMLDSAISGEFNAWCRASQRRRYPGSSWPASQRVVKQKSNFMFVLLNDSYGA